MGGSLSVFVLLAKAPLLLVALNPISRHLILVAPLVDLAPFVAVASSRLLFHVFLSYLLGRIYGQNGIRWLEKKHRQVGRVLRFIEKFFKKAPILILFAMPGTPTSILAGNSNMWAGIFLPVALAGILIRLFVIYLLGEWLRGYLMPVIGFIKVHWVPLTAVVVVIYVTVGILKSWKSTR